MQGGGRGRQATQAAGVARYHSTGQARLAERRWGAGGRHSGAADRAAAQQLEGEARETAEVAHWPSGLLDSLLGVLQRREGWSAAVGVEGVSWLPRGCKKNVKMNVCNIGFPGTLFTKAKKKYKLSAFLTESKICENPGVLGIFGEKQHIQMIRLALPCPSPCNHIVPFPSVLAGRSLTGAGPQSCISRESNCRSTTWTVGSSPAGLGAL